MRPPEPYAEVMRLYPWLAPLAAEFEAEGFRLQPIRCRLWTIRLVWRQRGGRATRCISIRLVPR